MHALAAVWPFAGRLAPRPFALAAALLYAVGFASQLLTLPAILAHAGAWPFALAQMALLWAWFTLHAQRLRDAGLGFAPAAGIAVIAALALILLLLAVAFYFDPADAPLPGTESHASAAMLPVHVLGFLFGMVAALPTFGLAGFLLLLLVALACLPLPLAVGFSVWAGTRAPAPDARPA
jgi:uncharacterized membrane protein YhaH (DUF805 family)